MGNRDAETGLDFIDDLRDRLTQRVQLTTAGLSIYLRAVETSFGWGRIDYAMLVKIYGSSPDVDAARRYSPAKCLGTERKWVMGNPKPDDICTSHVERHNLTMRMQMRRFTRLTKRVLQEGGLSPVRRGRSIPCITTSAGPMRHSPRPRRGSRRRRPWPPGWRIARGPFTTS